MLVQCFNGEANWDEFDVFLAKAQVSPDNAIFEIGGEFWTILDPEEPENLASFMPTLLFRTLLFLDSNHEYIKPPSPPDKWRVLPYVLLCIYIGTPILFYMLMPIGYALLAFFVFHLVFCSIFKLPKGKPPTPEEEETFFWPFTSMETYQSEKATSGDRIQAIGENANKKSRQVFGAHQNCPKLLK